MDTRIRLITEGDHAAVLAVYAPYVLHTAITFEYEVPSQEEFSQRLTSISKQYPVLVCEIEGEVVAYCYGGIHRAKIAYQWSVESTIYMSGPVHGHGVARLLYSALFDILRLQGYINVYAGVSVPDSRSDHFHQRFEFKTLGVFEKIGFKFGKWHDLKWFEYSLAKHSDHPSPPISIESIKNSTALKNILNNVTNQLHMALSKE